ncbi:aminotransferase class I/II-fold pyridoxal phosphate-dependent enzyme [Streptomyces noursei]|uniref:trans-sulfuration enzyme family protein n=1 Tax=Streptomyces noursei TaxID=1971 RepID=UPI0033ECAD80
MSFRPQTRTVHHVLPDVSGSTPLTTPLYQGHVFRFEDAEALAEAFGSPDGAFVYARHGNPTVRAFELAMVGLEGGAAALATASGMGAISTVLRTLLSSGDHVVAQRSLYGGTHAALTDLAERWGVEVTFVSGQDAQEVRAALRPRTRVLYLETIANPTTWVCDLSALAASVADRADVLTVVDNTFATPLLCRPLEHGADIVLHSATKYLGGHADVLGGVAVFRDAAVHRRAWEHSLEHGAVLDPFAAWLTLRGMQTLGLRIARQCENALVLAERLAAHPAVLAVHYPMLETHPDHEVARRQLTGGGGLLAFDVAGGARAGRALMASVELASVNASLGDVRTFVLHPASTSHRQLAPEARAAAGIDEGTIRLAVGIEDVEDLWADLEQALNKTGTN